MKVLLALLIVAAMTTAAHARAVSYAIIIGNNAPPADATGAGLAKLSYADDDAVRYYLLFSQFARASLLSTLDDTTQKRYPKLAGPALAPTLEVLRHTIADVGDAMRRDRQAGDEPVLYLAFSGHGAVAESGEAFLVLGDGRLTQRVLFDELIASLPTPRVHLIIDACHAGGVVGVRGGAFFDKQATGQTAPVSQAEVLAITEASVLERYPNVGVLAATTLANETHEWSAYEAGVFSYEVLSGLSGAADANGDHAIEYSELQAFVTSANRSIENPRAVPMMIAEAPRANRRAPLVQLEDLRMSYLLHGDLGAWGHFWVEREDGQRILDAHVSRERPATIALPLGTAVYVRTPHGDARVAGTSHVVAARELQLAPAKTASRGGVDADYRDNLFANAYGPTYYRGYVDSHGEPAVDFHFDVNITGNTGDGDAPPVEPRDTDPGRWWRRGSYVLALGCAVTGTVAVVSLVDMYSARSEFEDAPTRNDASYAAYDYHDAARIFLVTGALATAFGVGTWALTRHGQHLNIAAAATSSSVGLSLSGNL